ncbi:tetratricopeptide repeat protein [Blastopirellula marina]|uniref:Ancillary SecYEG translocon subunit/Cell division coordinator CpoB TPR domain-containing protein n=1 Tax=Blastopirellula marina TaxID=124 RepID=A0A2S8GLK7_9BACT|nr:tetratricopeptide repeat protein [Blastopirellula marina]PQO45326.1 hypothetical protein C5Y93_15365 [Blastopirellula marina]
MKPLFQKRLLIIVLALCAAWGSTSLADRKSELYQVASFHYGRSEWQPAIEAFDLFLSENPDHPQVGVIHFYRGECLLQLGRYDEALRAHTQFLSKSAGHPFTEHSEFRMAECYFLSGQSEAAANAFDLFLSKYPTSTLGPHAYPYLGQIAVKDQQWQEAVLMFNKAVKAAASPKGVIEARLGLARSYSALHRWKEAGSAYEQLLIDLKEQAEEYPTGPIAMEAGIAEYRGGNYRRGVSRFELAAKNKAELSDQANFWIAKTYFQVRDWPNALERLEQLKEKKALPDFQEEIHYLVAKIKLEEGKSDEAVALFDEQLKQWPESAWADEALYQQLSIALDQDKIDAATETWAKLAKLPATKQLTIRGELALAAALQRHDKHSAAIDVLNTELAGIEWEADDVQRRDYLAAVSLFATDHIDEARELLIHNQAQTEGNYRGLSLLLLGMIQSHELKWEDAAASFAASLEFLESTEHRNLAQVRRTAALLHLEKPEEAKQAWNHVDRDHVPTTQYLSEVAHVAAAAFRAGDTAWARELYSQMASDGNPEKIVEQGLAGLAWCQLNEADATAATQALDDLLAKNPKSPLAAGALYQQAQQLEATDLDLALARYGQLIEILPGDRLAAHARLRSATILDQLSRDAEAEVMLVKLAEEQPDVLPAEDIWYRLAWVRLDQKKLEEALEAFEQIHQKFRESDLWEDATYRLAEAALKAGETDKAREYLKQLLKDEGPASESETEDAQTTVAESKVKLYSRYMLGQVEVQAGNWKAAIEQMDAVAKAARTEPLHSMASFWSAEARFRLEKFGEAKTHFEQLLTETLGREIDSQPVAEMRLAQICAHEGDWDLAYEKAQEIGDKYPNFQEAHELDYLMGRCLARQGEFGKARAAYAKVVQSPVAGSSETAAMAQWMIGETYFHQKNYDAAVRAYSKVAAVHGTYAKWKAAALLQIGKCHEVQEDWENATKYYTEVKSDHVGTPFAPEAETRLSVVRQRTQQAQREATRK